MADVVARVGPDVISLTDIEKRQAAQARLAAANARLAAQESQLAAQGGESTVVRMARQFQAQILAQEPAQMELMTNQYLSVMASIQESIDALAQQIADIQARGEALAIGRVYQLERYQRLMVQLSAELNRFNGTAEAAVAARQRVMIDKGLADAKSLLDALRPGINVRFDALHVAALNAMIGNAADGTPLAELFQLSWQQVAQNVAQALVKAVASGQGPRETARVLRKVTGMPLTRALAISRTEQLRSYRMATQETYAANGIQLYIRVAAHDGDACIGCLCAEGEIMDSSEVLDDHVNGHCSSIPMLPGENPEDALAGMTSAEDWFATQDEAAQISQMGQSRYNLYKSGQASWKELTTHVPNATWGGAWVPTPVGALEARLGLAPGAALKLSRVPAQIASATQKAYDAEIAALSRLGARVVDDATAASLDTRVSILQSYRRSLKTVSPQTTPELHIFRGGSDPIKNPPPCSYNSAGQIQVNVDQAAWSDARYFAHESDVPTSWVFSDTSADHALTHELMHARQSEQMGGWGSFRTLTAKGMSDQDLAAAQRTLAKLWERHPELGRYAGSDSPVEFLAEVATGSSHGVVWTDDVWRQYLDYGGFREVVPADVLSRLGEPALARVGVAVKGPESVALKSTEQFFTHPASGARESAGAVAAREEGRRPLSEISQKELADAAKAAGVETPTKAAIRAALSDPNRQYEWHHIERGGRVIREYFTTPADAVEAAQNPGRLAAMLAEQRRLRQFANVPNFADMYEWGKVNGLIARGTMPPVTPAQGHLITNAPRIAKTYVSKSAASDPQAFIAEVYEGLRIGKTYPSPVMELYAALGGPLPEGYVSAARAAASWKGKR